MPILSVIIPVFNGENFIMNSLISLENQSLKDIEIIIIDDASTDNTIDVVNEFISKTKSNVKFLRNNKNKGTGYTRNKGIKFSSGKYITFLDSDDWVDSNAYLAAINAAQEDTDVIVFGIKNDYLYGQDSDIRYDYSYDNLITGEFALKLLCHSQNQDQYISPIPGNKIIRKEIITDNNVFFPNRNYCEDDEFYFKLLYYSNQIQIVSKVYMHYYQRPDSIMHCFSKKHIDDFISLFNNLRDFLTINNVFDVYNNDYYSFFNKCLNSLISSLFSNEQEVNMQKDYIEYLFKKILATFSISEILSFTDMQRIKRFFI